MTDFKFVFVYTCSRWLDLRSCAKIRVIWQMYKEWSRIHSIYHQRVRVSSLWRRNSMRITLLCVKSRWKICLFNRIYKKLQIFLDIAPKFWVRKIMYANWRNRRTSSSMPMDDGTSNMVHSWRHVLDKFKRYLDLITITQKSSSFSWNWSVT